MFVKPPGTVQSVDGTDFAAWLSGRIGDRSNGQVAKYVGVSPSTVHYWRTGQSLPGRRNVLKLARYLEVEPAEIEALLPSEAPESGLAPSRLAREIAAEVVALQHKDERLGPQLEELRRQMLGLPEEAWASVFEVVREIHARRGPAARAGKAGKTS